MQRPGRGVDDTVFSLPFLFHAFFASWICPPSFVSSFYFLFGFLLPEGRIWTEGIDGLDWIHLSIIADTTGTSRNSSAEYPVLSRGPTFDFKSYPGGTAMYPRPAARPVARRAGRPLAWTQAA